MNTLSTHPAEDFARLAVALHEEVTVHETVETVLEFAMKATGADAVGVIFLHGGKRVATAAATDPVVAKVDAIQMETGEGPDVSVLDENRVSLMVHDTHTDGRWPTWASLVSEAGIRCLLSIRMYTSESVVGTLNLYSHRPAAFDLDDQAVAHILAQHAAIALASARRVDNLSQAVDARKRIGQAQGILMERYTLTADQAFEVLRRYSQDNNVKLRQVADILVETRALPD